MYYVCTECDCPVIYHETWLECPICHRLWLDGGKEWEYIDALTEGTLTKVFPCCELYEIIGEVLSKYSDEELAELEKQLDEKSE